MQNFNTEKYCFNFVNIIVNGGDTWRVCNKYLWYVMAREWIDNIYEIIYEISASHDPRTITYGIAFIKYII